MRTRFLLQGIGRIRRLLSGRAVGASMLWAIGALVVLGAVGAGIALMSPSALQSKLEQEAGMRAYYNANAGLNFLNSMRDTAIAQKVNFTNFISLMGGDANVTYALQDNDVFSYELGNIINSGTIKSFQITNLTGSVVNAYGGKQYSYVIYGYGKGVSNVIDYKEAPVGESDTVIYAPDAAVSISGKAKIKGNIKVKSLIVEQAEINGDIISSGDVNVGFSTTLNGSLCSSGNVTIKQSVVSDAINAAGDVDLKFGSTVMGDIFSGGFVKIGDQVKIYGKTNANSYIELQNKDNLYESVFSNADVSFKNSETVIAGNAYAKNAINMVWGSEITGVAIAKTVNRSYGDSIGSVIETTEFPPNIKATEPTECTKQVIPNLKALQNDSSEDVKIKWAETTYDKDHPLNPGKYRNLTMATYTEITLKSGVYYFNSVETGYGSKINYDLTDGDITIFVTDNVEIEGANVINVKAPDEDWADMSDVNVEQAAKIYWEAHGNAEIGWGTDWFGTLYAKDYIKLDGGNEAVVGSFITSGTINDIDWDANIIFVGSNYVKSYW